MEGVRFRVSRAEDAQASAPLVHASGPESFDYVFASARGSAVPFLTYTLGRSGGEFGYGTHVVAELYGRVVACGAGWTHGGARFALATAWPAVSYLGLREIPGAYRRRHAGRDGDAPGRRLANITSAISAWTPHCADAGLARR